MLRTSSPLIGALGVMKSQLPTPVATFERAFRLSNMAMHSVALQVRRLRSSEPEDSIFVLRKWSDFDFLVVSLTRLRRAVQLACELSQAKAALESALQDFDEALPKLKEVRDVAEHIDDYSVEKGRRKSVSRFALEVSSICADGPTLDWLGAQVNANSAFVAAENLFLAMQTVKKELNHHDA